LGYTESGLQPRLWRGAAGFAAILAAAAFRLGWVFIVFVLIFLTIWQLAAADQRSA
jgi:hypothetical protein